MVVVAVAIAVVRNKLLNKLAGQVSHGQPVTPELAQRLPLGRRRSDKKVNKLNACNLLASTGTLPVCLCISLSLFSCLLIVTYTKMVEFFSLLNYAVMTTGMKLPN